MDRQGNFTYILECSDGTYYCGWTNDIIKRLKSHNAGTGCIYTRSRFPVKLVYLEEFATRKEAMSREYEIKKKYTRHGKEELIREYRERTEDLIRRQGSDRSGETGRGGITEHDGISEGHGQHSEGISARK